MDLKNKKVTVMGLGLHGGAIGTIEWLHKQGANIVVTDMKTDTQLAASVDKIKKYKNVTLVLGQHRTEDFTNTSLVIRNPAVPRQSPHLLAAKKAGVSIEMDSSLFFLNAPTKDIIGVTGSKGKTTTSHAIAHLLSATKVGTDGVSPLKELGRIQKDAPVVFELSSWRLEALMPHQISPATAVVTSIYPEHLNTYANFEEYVETKKQIIRNQHHEDTAVLNYDDEHIRQWEDATQGKILWFSSHPLPEDCFGAYIEDNMAIVRLRDKEPMRIPLKGIAFQADHETRNLLPAILLAAHRGATQKSIEAKLLSLPRLPHRLEPLHEIDGVTFINDSAATMPNATIAALKSLGTTPLVLIAGGGDKKLQFEELAQELTQHTLRGIVWLPGTATSAMQQAVLPMVPNTVSVDATDMNDAVSKSRSIARAGDSVLLSPGATSFGLFLHEFDRGEQFKNAVAALAKL